MQFSRTTIPTACSFCRLPELLTVDRNEGQGGKMELAVSELKSGRVTLSRQSARLISLRRTEFMPAHQIKRIVILGGGFGGLYTALELEKELAGDSSVSVTLVNRENFFLFTPMLHEIAGSDVDFTDIVSPIRQLLKRVEFFHGEVQAIDLQSRRVRLVHGPER